MDTTSTDTTRRSFWEFKKFQEHQWFKWLATRLLFIAAAYLIIHILIDLFCPKYSYEYSKLDARQLQQINRIYFDSTGTKKDSLPISGIADTLIHHVNDTTVTRQVVAHYVPVSSIADQPCDRAIAYIDNEYNGKIDSFQLAAIKKYLCSAKSPFEATNFLSDVRLRVRSYFWLTGPMVYIEIIFWSIFGVLSSLLFNLGLVSRGNATGLGGGTTEFDSAEIPSQVAKILYAPLCTLVIVLGYNFFSDENIVDISSSKGVIVFAFIGGFYSSRLIAFLDRLKEVLLPHGAGSDGPGTNTTPTTAPTGGVTISLELDDAFTPEDLKNDIAETGLGDAKVTLQNDKGEDPVTATRKGEDQSSTFVAAQLKPGKYTIKASWSKEINGEPVNLEGTQDADIKNDDTPVTVTMKKTKDEG